MQLPTNDDNFVFSPDGVVPSRMVGVSACVNLPLHRFSSGTGWPGWSQKKALKRLWCGGGARGYLFIYLFII